MLKELTEEPNEGNAFAVARLKAIKTLAKFQDERSIDAIVEMLEDPKNYIFYYDIITIMDEFGGYNKFKNRIREVGHRAMLNDRISND